MGQNRLNFTDKDSHSHIFLTDINTKEIFCRECGINKKDTKCKTCGESDCLEYMGGC